MDSDLSPDPLVAADVDLRGMPWMPLDTQRLLDSDLFALATAEEFRAAVVLWCKAWQQVPAGSLPADERVLAHLSGAGARWPRVRDMAMRGFVLCNDGRFYHSVIAEKVADAWAERLRNRQKQRRWRVKSQLRNGNAESNVTVTLPVTLPERNAGEGQGQGQGQGSKTLETFGLLSGSAEPSPDADNSQAKPEDPAKAAKTRRLNADAAEVLAFLNRATGSRFQPVDATLRLIRARISEFDVPTAKRVIADRWERWADDAKMSEYLRPATLFAATNFANYAGQLPPLAESPRPEEQTHA